MEQGKENTAPQGPAGGKPSLSRGELGQLLGQCLKLASENKITAQNTWSLPLIENLPELIKEEGTQTNFQRASVTLDAGVRIYSYRVDSVHTETFKMLSTFGRASGPQHGDGAEGGGEGEGVEGEGGGGGRRRKGRGLVELNPEATLEASLEALNVKKFDLAFAVDPLFHKTSAQFDEGGAKGLLLNNLSVYRGCEIVFDSMDVPEQAVDSAAFKQSAADVDMSCVRSVLEGVGQLSGQERISPTLDDILRLLGQAPGEDAAAAADELVREVAAAAGDVQPAPSGSFMQTSTFSGAPGGGPDSVDQPGAAEGAEQQSMMEEAEEGRLAHAYGGGVGAGLGDIDEYDREYGDGDDGGGYDMGGGFDDFSDSEGQQHSAVQHQLGQPGAVPSSSAKKGRCGSLGGEAIQWLISAGTSSSSSITGNAWAGGSHWRYRATAQQPGGALEEGEQAEGGRGRKKTTARKKKNEPLDFVALLEQPEQPAFGKLQQRKAAARPKRAVDTLLPEDLRYKPETLTHYALRPHRAVAGAGEAATRRGLGGGAALGLDIEDFGAAGASDDDEDQDAGTDFGGWDDFGGGADLGAAGGGGYADDGSMLPGGAGADEGAVPELLSAPRKVEKVEVNYSRAAKQVDVRALKETLWEGLHQVLPAGQQQQRQEAVVSFQDVLATVQEANPAGRLEDLSVHLCFICVLHLANEHGLVVRGVPELDRLELSNVPPA